MNYYDLQKNWDKVAPHVEHPNVQLVLFRDLNVYLDGNFKADDLPSEHDWTDWGSWWWSSDLFHSDPPQFWYFTLHRACHWLVNFNLLVAQRTAPDRPWRIITSDRHSTVWDGEHTLFDFNYLAMDIPPQQCFDAAYNDELQPGERMPAPARPAYTAIQTFNGEMKS